MVVTMSTLALLATGLKAVTWTWFSFKAIKLACKLGKSINLEAKKGRQPLPKFQSGRIEKFYKSTSKQARPRFSRNNEKLAERRMEAIMEGSNVTLINNMDKKASERQQLLKVKVKEEIDEDRIINSIVMTNFSGCNNDCDCSNATDANLTASEDTEDFATRYRNALDANLTASEDTEDIATRYRNATDANLTASEDTEDFATRYRNATDANLTPSGDIAIIAKDAAQELKSLWRNDVASDTPTKYTNIKARNDESMNCSLASSGEESQEDCHCSIILETPVKHGHVKSQNNGNIFESQNNGNIFEASIIAGKNDGEFESLRNSTPATYPAMKCEFDLSFKIPKAQPPLSALMKQPHALQLLDDLPELSLEDSHSNCESYLAEEDVEMTDIPELTDGGNTPILNRKFRADAQISDGKLNDSTFPNIQSCSASPPLRKPRTYKMKRVAEKDFSDIVYDEIVKSAKSNVSVDVVNVLDAYENSKETSDFLVAGGSISFKEITLKLPAAKVGLNSSNVEDMGAMQVTTDEASDLVEYTDPLRVWTPTLESVIPPWNKEMLPTEAMPPSLETPPTPPRIDKSLLTFLEKFEEEESKPTAIDEIIMEEDELKAVEGLGDGDEVVVSYNNFALIRTTPATIRKSICGQDIGGRCENDDSPNNATGDVLNNICIVEAEEEDNAKENDPMLLSVDVDLTTKKTVDITMKADSATNNTKNPDPIGSVKVKEMDSSENATKNDNDVNISLGVSYELINMDSKGESQTDDCGRNLDSLNSDTFNNTTKEVSGIDVFRDNDEANVNYSNSVISDGNDKPKVNENDTGHVDDVDISLLVNYEASPNRREDVVTDNDVTLVSIKGDSAFLNHTLPLINIKREYKYRVEEAKVNEKTLDLQIRKEKPEENLTKSKKPVTGQEIIIISDDEDEKDSRDMAGSPYSSELSGSPAPQASVSSLERSIVTDLQLNINGQFQVEEIGE